MQALQRTTPVVDMATDVKINLVNDECVVIDGSLVICFLPIGLAFVCSVVNGCRTFGETSWPNRLTLIAH